MNYCRERLIAVVAALFCLHLQAMEDRHLAPVHAAHRRVPSADAVRERQSSNAMAHMNYLRDELTSSGGYDFAEERPATRSRSNSALLGPVIEIDSFEVHQVNDSSGDTEVGSERENNDFSSDEFSVEGPIAMEDVHAPWGNDGFALGSKSSDEDENSVSSNENAATIVSLHTPSDLSDNDPIDTLYYSDKNSSLGGSVDSSDSENDPFGIPAPPGSPSQKSVQHRVPTPSGAAKTISYRKLVGCAIGAYVIYNVIDSLLSQFKQERAQKKRRTLQ